MERIHQKMKKARFRELTKNEKVLLSLLAIVIFIWVVYRFVLTPQWDRLETLKSEKIEYQVKIDEMNSILKKESQINKDWESLHKEKEGIVSRYFPKMDQAQIIYLLSHLMENEDIKIDDLNFNRPGYEDIGGLEVRNISVSIPYGGNYNGIIDLLNAIKTSPRKILVESLSMDRNESDFLRGNMSLKIYSLDGIAETDGEVIYIDKPTEVSKDTPFAPFTDYADASSRPEEEATIPEISPYVEETLLDFENRNNYFLPSQELVKGDVSLSTKAKSKKYSLRFEYNIVAVEEENRAFIDVSRNNIQLRYPPNTIGLWLYSYDYSPATVGIAFHGQMGEEILVPLTEGIGWTGWRYIETAPPADMGVYPLKLDKLYLEIPEGRDDFGVILLDKLEAVYTRNMSEDGSDNSIGDYIFHVVERGDTVEDISKKYYGSGNYKNEILRLNEMKAGDVLPVGKVLVLKKR